MAATKGHHSHRKNWISLYTTLLSLCLYFSGVSGQVLRSLTRPALIQTNGLDFQNSDPTNMALDFGVQSSAGLSFGAQSLVKPVMVGSNGERFPALGSASGAATLTGYNRGRSYQEIYTAIGKDKFDEESQMRLTITERFTNPRFSSYDAPTDWYVQGTFLNSKLRNKAGNYYVVLTSGGRTADGCDGDTLGQVVGRSVHQSSSGPSGMLPNHLMMGASGPTVYASTLEGISRRQLVGGGIAACESISSNGLCSGYIPFCATISKDLFQAMEIPVEHQIEVADPMPNVVPFDVSAANTVNTLPGIGDVLGSALGNDGGGLGLAINSPTAFSTKEQPTVTEEESPKAIGLFA